MLESPIVAPADGAVTMLPAIRSNRNARTLLGDRESLAAVGAEDPPHELLARATAVLVEAVLSASAHQLVPTERARRICGSGPLPLRARAPKFVATPERQAPDG